MSDNRLVVKQEPRMMLQPESVASLLDISVSMAYAMIRDGRISSVVIEGSTKRLVPMSKLKEFVQDCINRQVDDPAAAARNPVVLDRNL